MGLSTWLLRSAASRPRPLIVSVPYGTRIRLAVEAELAQRGWAQANSPAEASMLVVCGEPGAELHEAIRTTWALLPSPRALVELVPGTDVAQALSRAQEKLADQKAQWQDAAERLVEAAPATEHQSHARGEHEEHAHGGHEHHMGSPGGLKMADRAEARDGLKLDQLHVPLGPVLPDWPAGLVVETLLQGDVIQQATVKVLAGTPGERFWDQPWLEGGGRGEAERRRAACHLDSLGRLLSVAGWASQAARARRLRDLLLAGERPELERFARRVAGSWTLRWMLRDLPEVQSRVTSWLTRIRTAFDASSPLTVSERKSADLLAVLPELLEGAELATARLIVAGLDPDVERVLHD